MWSGWVGLGILTGVYEVGSQGWQGVTCLWRSIAPLPRQERAAWWGEVSPILPKRCETSDDRCCRSLVVPFFFNVNGIPFVPANFCNAPFFAFSFRHLKFPKEIGTNFRPPLLEIRGG